MTDKNLSPDKAREGKLPEYMRQIVHDFIFKAQDASKGYELAEGLIEAIENHQRACLPSHGTRSEIIEECAQEGDRVRRNATLLARGMPAGQEQWQWLGHANGGDETAYAIRALKDAPVSKGQTITDGPMIADTLAWKLETCAVYLAGQGYADGAEWVRDAAKVLNGAPRSSIALTTWGAIELVAEMMERQHYPSLARDVREFKKYIDEKSLVSASACSPKDVK